MPTPTEVDSGGYFTVEPLTPDGHVVKMELAGTYYQIGYALGKWYQEQGHIPRALTPAERKIARGMLGFYQSLDPQLLEQLQGLYAAYDLDLYDVDTGIPIWDEDGIRIMLPGLVEAHSCSVIYSRPEATSDGHARFGRNHDWPTELSDVALVFTAPQGGYATAVMTRGVPGLAASDGMNSEGLALGLASVSNPGYQLPDGPALVSNLAYRLVLEHSADVEQALKMLEMIPVTFVNPNPEELITHILLADRSGDSAVVEFTAQGVVVSRTDTPYQVMTNSHWSGPADQPGCPRYQTATGQLAGNVGRIDTAGLMGILFSLQSSTQWTVLYDLEDRSLVLTLPGDGFRELFEYSLADFVERVGR
jgi:predicted choloylglycine hydrolase